MSLCSVPDTISMFLRCIAGIDCFVKPLFTSRNFGSTLIPRGIILIPMRWGGVFAETVPRSENRKNKGSTLSNICEKNVE